jgi:hypothetical protein
MEWKPERRPVPREFVGMVNNGFDYDHSNTEEENRQRAQDGGYCDPELVSDEEYDSWRDRGEKLCFDAADHQWALGYWIVEGEDLWDLATAIRNRRFKHGVYMAAADITGLSVATIKDYAYVARNVPEEIRNKTLSFGHHKLIAGLEREQQLAFLSEMAVGHLTVGDARRRIQYVNRAKPKPKTESKDKADARAEQIIGLCEELLKLLSQGHITASTPAVYFALTDTVTKVSEVLDEEIAAASVRTDADAA